MIFKILKESIGDKVIKAEENDEKQKNETKEEKNQSTKEIKPAFKKGCKRDDCRFNKNGFCTSNAVNNNSLRCDITTNYMGFEERG